MTFEYLINLMNDTLRITSPFFLILNFILVLLFFYLSRKDFFVFFRKISKRTWAILFLIILLASFLRIVVAPHQTMMFEDEGWYRGTAMKFLDIDIDYFQDGFYKSLGWPFIMSLGFLIFGKIALVANYLSSFLGVLTVFNIFFIAFLLFNNEKIALWSSFLFSLIPTHIIWSGSAETNVASLFFITLTVFVFSLYFKEKKENLFWLSLLVLVFTFQIRPENHFLLFLFPLGLLIFNVYSFKKKTISKFVIGKLILIFLIFLICVPNLINNLDHYLSARWNEIDTGGKIIADNWSINNLTYNLLNHFPSLFNDYYHPILFSIFFFIGLYFLFSKNKKNFLFLGSWFLIFFFIYFISWPALGPKTRLFIAFYPITTIFVAVGINSLLDLIKNSSFRKFILIALVLSFLTSFSFYLREEIMRINFYLEGRMQTNLINLAEKNIPEDCAILANLPNMLATVAGSEVFDLNEFLKDKEYREDIKNNSKCLLFFKDYTCDPLMRFSPVWFENCSTLEENYRLKPFLNYSSRLVDQEKKTLKDFDLFFLSFSELLIDPIILDHDAYFYKNNIFKKDKSFGFYEIILEK